jgi:argininosuccinate lyase
MTETRPTFPHPIYSKHVLQPAYQGALEYLYGPMLTANRAHVVMLARQEIISRDNARALLKALAQVEAEGLEALGYKPGIEDLFFRVEGRLIELAGAEQGGNLQLARSRNDLGHTLTRLALRPRLLALYRRLLDLRESILKLAHRHLETVMPGYTHTQPAQPTTFAHYLAGVLSFLERDTQRLRQAYQTTNQSPIGAAAFTGTGFPINRRLSAELLGFSGVMFSSHDCIGASDHLTDIAAGLTSLGVNLSRMSKDLLFWATHESGALYIDDSFIQISSIMPQKRNPVVLEHLRARLSRLLGQTQTIVIQCHNIPYGDTQDIEDEIEPTVFGAIATADDILELYKVVFDTLQLNTAHLKAQAAAGFTTMTELADTLVREAGLPFRAAHQVVSRLVSHLTAEKLTPDDVTGELLAEVSQELLPEPPSLTTEAIQRALDPVAFVQARATLGGAAPSATAGVLNHQANQLNRDEAWLDEEQARLAAAQNNLDEQVANLVSS